jgi:hypothetical protein
MSKCYVNGRSLIMKVLYIKILADIINDGANNELMLHRMLHQENNFGNSSVERNTEVININNIAMANTQGPNQIIIVP